MRGTCRSWRALGSELTHSPCCLTLSRHLNVKGLINLLNATRTGISTTQLTKVSIRSASHLQYGSSYCEVYQAIASSCPKVRELTLNLEGPSNCWHGVGLLPEGLTSLSLGACRFPPGLPLTVFNELKQLQHLHLSLECSQDCHIGGNLHLPRLQTLQIDGSDNSAVYFPEFTREHIPATCLVSIRMHMLTSTRRKSTRLFIMQCVV